MWTSLKKLFEKFIFINLQECKQLSITYLLKKVAERIIFKELKNTKIYLKRSIGIEKIKVKLSIQKI